MNKECNIEDLPQEVQEGIYKALEEVRLHREGKKRLKTWEEFSKEMKEKYNL